MSHFTVLVIGEDVEGQLAKYDENTQVEEYETEIVTEEDKKSFMDYYTKEKTENIEENKKLSFDKLYKKEGEGWNGNTWRKDKEGVWREYSTYNPDSKWDWFEVGGRWAGAFILKKNVKLKTKPNFSWRWEEKDKQKMLDEHRSDVALKNEIKNLKEIKVYAVVKDGEWFAPGDMGWCGMSTETDSESAKWDNNFYDKFIKDLPDDTLLTMVDCHI